MSKLAVILFNMGGPDKLQSVKPFLFNLFNDPAIIAAPKPLRWLLAKLISYKRAPLARQIYQHIDNKSPLLELTQKQAKALEECLSCDNAKEDKVRVFVTMRYWHPMSDETACEIVNYNPDEIVLLPLYPQFSTATGGSSLKDWQRAARTAGINVPTYGICCYPDAPGFIAALKKQVMTAIKSVPDLGNFRMLLSAHGLPEKIVAKGDPYAWQIERTAKALIAALAIDDLDWRICYQSKVGPMEWLGPATIDELKRAANDRVSVIMVPVAFVSEHSETLVELDIEYRKIAMDMGVPTYIRVPTVGIVKEFIDGLAVLVRQASKKKTALISANNRRLCPADCKCCPY